MANRARGETGIRIGGKTFAIALNLGALAAIETEFGSDSFEDVFDDLFKSDKVSAAKLKRLLISAFEGNGLGEEIECLDGLMVADLPEISRQLIEMAFPDPGQSRKATGKHP